MLPACGQEAPPDAPVFRAAAWTGEPLVLADSRVYAEPGAVLAHDLDRDGDLDVAAVGPARCLWFENRGGKPLDFKLHPIDDQGCANGLAVLDLDGDAFPDIISAGGGPPDGRTMPGPLYVWHNPGKEGGAWVRKVLDDIPGNFLHDILSADLDNDGGPEIVALRGAAYLKTDPAHDGLVVYRGSGEGEDAAIWQRVPLQSSDGPIKPEDFGLAAGDLDGDGYMDLIQFRSVWLNPKGDIPSVWTGIRWTQEYVPSNLIARDMDGNGKLDIVFSEGHSHREGASRVGVWFNRGKKAGRLWGETMVLGAVPEDPENLAVADLDGNGVPDVVTGPMNWRKAPGSLEHPSWNDRDAGLVIFAGKRTASEECVWIRCEVRSGIAAFHHLSLADMDGNGDLDVLGENAGVQPPPAPVAPSVQILLN
jgi:hypothetical protein